MATFAQAPARGIRCSRWFASTAFTSVLLPLMAMPAGAQQSASPDLQIRQVDVNAPQQPARRAAPRPAAPQRRTVRAPVVPAVQPAPQPAPVVAPVNATIVANSADDPVVVSATGRPTPARNVASSVGVVNSQRIEQEQRRNGP